MTTVSFLSIRNQAEDLATMIPVVAWKLTRNNLSCGKERLFIQSKLVSS